MKKGAKSLVLRDIYRTVAGWVGASRRGAAPSSILAKKRGDMLVYSETKERFLNDVRTNIIHHRIQDKLRQKSFHNVGPAEVASWRNSMQFMGNVLLDPEIPADAQISVEYMIPLTSKRVDVIIAGRGKDDRDAVVIVELKQWSEVEATSKDGVVQTFLGGGRREVSHPSYQAWTYEQLIKDYNLSVQQNGTSITSCAYLHNLDDDSVIRSVFYQAHLDRSPVFISSDTEQLASFIKQHVKYGDAQTMYRIENSRLRPSKDLADSLASMITGNVEFIMIDRKSTRLNSSHT